MAVVFSKYVVQQRSSYAKEKYQAYVNAEMELLYALYYLADRYASYNLYENFFVKAVELMRKSAKGTADLKYYMVWALLAMGCDEEAYDVIKLWITTFDAKMDGGHGPIGFGNCLMMDVFGNSNTFAKKFKDDTNLQTN